MSTQIILVDGKNALYRHHFVNKFMTREDGHPTGALHGCLNSMYAMSSRLPEASFVWVWDGEGDTWRHRMMAGAADYTSFDFPDDEEDVTEDFVTNMVASSMSFLGLNATVEANTKARKQRRVGYKANRMIAMKKNEKDKYPTDEKSRALLQIPVLRLILRGMGIRQYEVQGLEGDDLVAMLVKRIFTLDKHADIIVHSGDKDYYQLLPDIRIMTRIEDGKLKWVGAEDVLEKFAVSVTDWVKYRALTGDSSDNIPHLWKVGPKTALRMLDAGMDASEPDYRKLDPHLFVKFARLFHPHGPEKLWGAVHGNYKLCKLVDDIESPLLSEDVQDRLRIMFSQFKSLRKFRSKVSERNAENYRKVNFLLAQYQLNTIQGELDELWNLP